MKNLGMLLLISALTAITLAQPGFAAEPAPAPTLSEPALLTEPEWEPWDMDTVGLQLLALPSAVGFGLGTVYAVGFVHLVAFDFDEMTDEQRERSYWIGVWGGLLSYTLAQGIFIGVVGDKCGGDGGVTTPVAVGLLNLAVWGGALYLGDVEPAHHDLMLGGFMVTTLISQLAAYHLTASSQDDDLDIMRERTAFSNFSLGFAPTDGGVAAGLGFQF